jgi:hypothetical protein
MVVMAIDIVCPRCGGWAYKDKYTDSYICPEHDCLWFGDYSMFAWIEDEERGF